MKKAQYTAIGLAALLFIGLYFGFSKTKPEQDIIDNARALDATPTAQDVLLTDSRAALRPEQVAELAVLEQGIGDERTSENLKKLAGWWVQAGFPEASGMIAEDIAEQESTAGAWSIAGATFHMALNKLPEGASRTICAKKAISAFEKAISLEPEVVEHRVNLALIYADAPPEDNPMQSVLMLRDLEQKYPEAPTVYNALGRLGIKTKQWEKAIARLEKALSLDPNNKNALCLLVQAYKGNGDIKKAQIFAQRCTDSAQ